MASRGLFFKSKILLLFLIVSTLCMELNPRHYVVKQLQLASMPEELKKSTTEIWCSGKSNFTVLCQSWPDHRTCIGRVIQAELWSVQNNTSLYDYSNLALGKMLLAIDCKKKQEFPDIVSPKPKQINVALWILPIAVLILIVVLILCFFSLRTFGRSGCNRIMRRSGLSNNASDATKNSNLGNDVV